jgi:hypothetical protein
MSNKSLVDAVEANEAKVGVLTTEDSKGEVDLHVDRAKEIKLLAKLDLAFTPIIMLVYLSCFLDRSNIGECWFCNH